MRIGKEDVHEGHAPRDQPPSPSPPRGAWGPTRNAQVLAQEARDPETLVYLPAGMRIGKEDFREGHAPRDQPPSPSPPRGAWGPTPDAQVLAQEARDPETLVYLPLRALYQEDDVTDFQEVMPSQTAQGLCKITIEVRLASTSRLRREVLPVMALVLLFSCLSTFFGWVLFGFACRGPHDDDLPDGYVSWTSCEMAAGFQGNRHVLTPLGQALDPSSLRLRVSAPKYWCVAALGVLVARLLRPRDRWAWVIVMTGNAVVAASSTYNLTTRLVVPSLGETDVIDQLTLGLILFTTFGVCACRTEAREIGLNSRCPRFIFYGSIAFAFLVQTPLMNMMQRIALSQTTGVSAAALACLLLVKCVDFGIRFIFKSVGVPPLPCTSVMFIFESTSLYVIRRSTLQELNDSIPELAASIVVFSLVEMLAHVAALLSAIHYHNLMIASHQREKANRYVAVFLLAILNDILAEHVALQGSLAVLFADSRIFDVRISKEKMVLGWVVQFVAELLVDMGSLAVLVSLLPVSFQDVAKLSGHLPCMSLVVICCLLVHQGSLQVLIREDAFRCA
eukprot:TRINITY_DN18492_c0_g1_i4.p1 TRINITY_DN18492_c0_g1~~TRINITY_DN18492_c0_g1_i4.p1  ORF type:complete len:562 (+),score=46.50 TRINITY_DN18492_c0_g1_i4:198-1883(+)